MTRTFTLFGLLLVLLGAIWTLQGFGLIEGSFMTGQTRWSTIGIATTIAGAALILWANLRRRAP